MNKHRILTVILVVMVYAFTTVLLNYSSYIDYMEKISAGYSSSLSTKINSKIFLGHLREKNFKKLLEEPIDNYIIFDDSFNNKQLRGVLIKGDVSPPRLIEGRFFEQDDFFSSKKVVVIGENLVGHTYLENGKRYFSLFNDLYEVVGICGYGSNSTMDNIILYNLDSIHHPDWGVYTIESSNRQNTKQIVQAIAELGEIEIIDEKNEGVKRLLGYDYVSNIIQNLGVITIILLFFSKNKSFISAIQKLLDVSKFVGFSLKETIYLTFDKWLIYEAIGICTSMITHYFFRKYYNSNPNSVGSTLTVINIILFNASFMIYISYILYHWRKKGVKNVKKYTLGRY